MADVRFSCPGCGQVLEVPPEMAGELAECPTCQQQFLIPDLEPTDNPSMQSSNAMSEATKEALAAQDNHRCMECGAAMEDGAVLCLSCGFHKKLGKKIATDFG